MLSWVLQTTILSIVFIFIIHHLIIFFKDNLTIPKIKDLVHAPNQKYNDIYNIISSNKKCKQEETYYQEENNYNVESNHKPDIDLMKNELKNFLKEQLHNNSISTTSIDDLDNNYISL
jgi:hypothetical protein